MTVMMRFEKVDWVALCNQLKLLGPGSFFESWTLMGCPLHLKLFIGIMVVEIAV